MSIRGVVGVCNTFDEHDDTATLLVMMVVEIVFVVVVVLLVNVLNGHGRDFTSAGDADEGGCSLISGRWDSGGLDDSI